VSAAVAAMVALGFGVALVRRRSLAIALVAVQGVLLGVVALARDGGDGGAMALAGAVLLFRAVAIPVFLTFARRRTPEPTLVAPTTSVATRLLLTAAVVLVAVAATPPLGFDDRVAEHGAVAMLCLGIAIVVLRRPAVLQVAGILVAENGAYLLAIAAPGGVPAAIELGVLFDLVVVITVAVAFAGKIHEHFGSGDTDLLRGLRD
jgi:hydrogenase-4 component E